MLIRVKAPIAKGDPSLSVTQTYRKRDPNARQRISFMNLCALQTKDNMQHSSHHEESDKAPSTQKEENSTEPLEFYQVTLEVGGISKA